MMRYFWAMMMCISGMAWAETSTLHTVNHCQPTISADNVSSAMPVCTIETDITLPQPVSGSIQAKMADDFIPNANIRANTQGQSAPTYSPPDEPAMGVAVALNGKALNQEWQTVEAVSETNSPKMRVQYWAKPVESSGKGLAFRAGTLALLKTADGRIYQIHSDGANIQVRQATCKLLAFPNEVKLTDIHSSQIAKKGNEIKGGEISVQLECPEHIKVYTALTDQNNFANTSNVLTNKGTAQGVGVKLYRPHQHQTAQTLGQPPAADVFDAPNQFLLSQNQTHPTLKLDAYYVNTQGAINAGSVSSTVLMTFSYQ